MSKAVKIDNIEPGMIIDRDVTNPQGAVLLKKGCEITERHINVFRTWGIGSIYIKDEVSVDELDGKTLEEAATLEIEGAKSKIEKKFAGFADDEIMQAIKVSALRYKEIKTKKKFNIK